MPGTAQRGGFECLRSLVSQLEAQCHTGSIRMDVERDRASGFATEQLSEFLNNRDALT